MQVSDVQIAFIKPQNGLIAFASVVIDSNFYLGSIGVHQKLDGSGYRLTYPTKPHHHQQMNIYHPIHLDASKAIEKAVFDKLKDVMSEHHAGYRSDSA